MTQEAIVEGVLEQILSVWQGDAKDLRGRGPKGFDWLPGSHLVSVRAVPFDLKDSTYLMLQGMGGADAGLRLHPHHATFNVATFCAALWSNFTLPLTTTLSLIATGSFAEENRATLTAMLSVAGECQMLIFSEEERLCKDVIINTQYDSGRIGFYFKDESEGGGFVSFSGMGPKWRAPSENLRLLPIDALIIDEERVPALGFCTFEDPYVGKARIECSAYHENGELFSGFFVSDGSRPELMAPGGNDG